MDDISRLKLVSPIYYIRMENPDPFAFANRANYRSGGETLFCFELECEQAFVFEPYKEKLLRRLVFGGDSLRDFSNAAKVCAETSCELPWGDYLFVQRREILDRETITALAIEIQQEGLWQRLEIGRKLYIRRLFEDGRFVTQLFRPYNAPEI